MANSNGWGDGSVNNNIGWGQGAVNNNIGWGNSQLTSWSGATDIDGGNLPVNTVAPAITGTAQEGQTLTCSTGTWTGSPTPTYTYQWKRNGSNIGSATNSTYTLVTADVGTSIKCTVTATNAISSINADSNTVTPTSSTDADAQAFITAAAITDPTQQGAINTLVTDLKGYSIWTKFKAIYPIVGGVASSHAVNLKTPGTFNLTFATGLTHSANGMISAGAGYANTNLNQSVLSQNSTHLSFYSRTNVNANEAEIGINGPNYNMMQIRVSGAGYYLINTAGLPTASETDSRGFFIGNRQSSNDIDAWKNGVKKLNGTTASATVVSGNLFLLAYNNQQGGGGASAVSTKQCAFASIGDGLTDTEAANFYTAVQAFQTTLGREMIENQQLELDAGNTNSYPGTGTTWTDLSGNSRTGTLFGTVGYSSLNGGYLTFNGSSAYVSVNNVGPVLNNVNKFTLNTWFKLTDTSLNNTIFSFGNNGFYNDDILLAVYGNTLLAQVNVGGDGSATIGFTSTAWTNIQVVYDGTLTGNANRLKIYINGVLQTLSFTYTVPASTSNLSFSSCGIGAYSTGGFVNRLSGNISVTELYSSAFDQSQVTANFNSIKSRYGL